MTLYTIPLGEPFLDRLAGGILSRHAGDDPAALAELTLGLVADDGAVVYLNGVEVLRTNMPTGRTIEWNTRPLTWRSGADEDLAEFTVPGSALVAGTNTVTVEVHNFWPGNADLSFDLALGPVG